MNFVDYNMLYRVVINQYSNQVMHQIAQEFVYTGFIIYSKNLMYRFHTYEVNLKLIPFSLF